MKLIISLPTILFLMLILLVQTTACNKTQPLDNLAAAQYVGPPQVVTLQVTGYQPQPGDTFQNIFVSNYSVGVFAGQLQYSTARDMSDTLKNALNPNFGFTLNSPESVVPGFADLALYQAGINIGQQATLVCDASLTGNASADGLFYHDDRVNGSPTTFLGLRDCDKQYLGLNPNLFNYNGNGMPDYLQIRCGMNPLDTNQGFVSTSGDGVSDFDKCKLHIPISESANTQPNQTYSYNYNTQVFPDGTTTFTVSNIPIMNAGVENFIAVYLVETNSVTHASSLYSAYAVLTSGFAGQTLKVPYWATGGPSTFTDQEIVVP